MTLILQFVRLAADDVVLVVRSIIAFVGRLRLSSVSFVRGKKIYMVTFLSIAVVAPPFFPLKETFLSKEEKKVLPPFVKNATTLQG